MPDQTPTTCPACGASATGNFCSTCGASLSQRVCAHCQAELSAQARFCHRCGQPAGAGAAGAAAGGAARTGEAAAARGGAGPVAARSGSERAAWIFAGAVCVLMVGAIVYRVAGDTPAPAAPDMANPGVGGAPAAGGAAGGGPAGPAPDISRMTPRERFDRLFNRIMEAAERGDRAQVEQFTPMALGAYSQLDTFDADARYHAAVLQLQTGNVPAALALADTILAESPGHLFGYIVRGEAAALQKDAVRLAAARRDFLAHYDAEMKANRVEYLDHRPVIDQFKQEASR